MSKSIYCLDNDIILKLATFDLCDDTLKIFGINANQVKILDSFKYKFSKQIQRKRGNNVKDVYDIKKALEISQNYTTISEHNLDSSVVDIYNKLLDYSNKDNTIDKGEASLISYLCYLNQQGDNNYLLTCDKRCLKGLTNSGFTDVVEHINGKVWCLEQLILMNIEEFGFDVIEAKVYPVRDCDSNIKYIFGYSIKSPENRVKEDLKNEIRTLKEQTGNLLYSYPK